MKLATSALVFCVGALTALGIVMLVSASAGQREAHYLVAQPIWCGLGVAVCLAAVLGDYRWLKARPWVPWLVLGVASVLLALVFVPHVGLKINGSRRWLGLATLRFQPSEFAKIALIIALAWYGEHYQRQMPRFWRGVVLPGCIILLPVGLVAIEVDVGTAVLLAAVGGVLLLLAGMRLWYFLGLAGLALGVLVGYVSTNAQRSDRIYSWLHLEETKLDKGLQVYQGIVALGSGGAYGKGIGDGRQKLGFVPEHHTDFIFTIIGEELGLLATLLVLLGYLAIVGSGTWIAWHARDLFGMLLAAGITVLIAFQVIINIAVVTNLLPNKGLSLPFISYGGSNVVLMFGCIGLLISVARHATSAGRVLHRDMSDHLAPSLA